MPVTTTAIMPDGSPDTWSTDSPENVIGVFVVRDQATADRIQQVFHWDYPLTTAFFPYLLRVRRESDGTFKYCRVRSVTMTECQVASS